MGLDPDSLKFLLLAAAEDVDLGRTATIGRQQIFRLDERTLRRIFDGFGRPLEPGEARRLLESDGGYADGVLRRLGAGEIAAVDVSAYEGSQIVHDMNLPVPGELHGRFSTVIDGGSLEHVFNFPVALANCMRMVDAGGHLVIMTPANNFFGHGFYQTSPELYFRALAPDNGFEVERVLVRDWTRRERWYEVADPMTVGRRVTLLTTQPTVLYVRARRVSDAAPLTTMPQQSDYEALWEGEGPTGMEAGESSGARRRGVGLLKGARDRAPKPLKELAAVHVARRRRMYDRSSYRPVSLERLARR